MKKQISLAMSFLFAWMTIFPVYADTETQINLYQHTGNYQILEARLNDSINKLDMKDKNKFNELIINKLPKLKKKLDLMNPKRFEKLLKKVYRKSKRLNSEQQNTESNNLISQMIPLEFSNVINNEDEISVGEDQFKKIKSFVSDVVEKVNARNTLKDAVIDDDLLDVLGTIAFTAIIVLIYLLFGEAAVLIFFGILVVGFIVSVFISIANYPFIEFRTIFKDYHEFNEELLAFN